MIRTTNQTIPNNIPTAIAFSNPPEFDQNGPLFNPGFPSRLFAPVTGIYQITGAAVFAFNAQMTLAYAQLLKNGTDIIGEDLRDPVTPVAAGVILTVTATVKLMATEYVSLYVDQVTSDTSSTDVSAIADYSPTMSMVRVG